MFLQAIKASYGLADKTALVEIAKAPFMVSLLMQGPSHISAQQTFCTGVFKPEQHRL